MLHLYLAWEAAEQGDSEAASRAVAAGGRLPVPRAGDLCDALLVRAARVLAGQDGVSSDPQYWLRQWSAGRDAGALLARYQPARPLAPAERDPLLERIKQRMEVLEQTASEADLREAWISAHPFASNAEAVGVPDLTTDLQQLIAHPEGLHYVRRLLELFLSNPYPRYRDLALVALGQTCVAIPDPTEAREREKEILRAALDQEGVTFTFDLPSVLLAEAARRGLDHAELKAYVEEAHRTSDAWTTAVRAQSAAALAEHHLGRGENAQQLLRTAQGQPGGYAGFAVLAALSLASRWREFGFGWNPEVEALVKGADEAARRVRDPQLGNDRFMLVNTYRQWWQQAVPTLDGALADLARMEDQDVRTTYVDYVSACWSASGPAPHPDWLTAFVAPSLVDGTRLDAVLARWLGPRLTAFKDEQLNRALDVCFRQLTMGRPWAAAQVVGPG